MRQRDFEERYGRLELEGYEPPRARRSRDEDWEEGGSGEEPLPDGGEDGGDDNSQTCD